MKGSSTDDDKVAAIILSFFFLFYSRTNMMKTLRIEANVATRVFSTETGKFQVGPFTMRVLVVE